MKRIIFLCAMILCMSGSANSQSLLKKGLKYVKQQVENAQTNNQKNRDEAKKANADKPETGQDNEEGIFIPKSNFYSLDEKQCQEKFANFKTTDSTKIINLDDIGGIRLGYFNNNRAFVYTSSNGIICIDREGEIIKEFANIIDVPLGARFDSDRIILPKGLFGDATIYDSYFRIIKELSNYDGFSNYADGVALVNAPSNNSAQNKRQYIDVNGNPIFNNLTTEGRSVQLDDIRKAHEGLTAFQAYNPKDGKVYWGFRNASGKVIIPAKYNYAQDFSQGLAAVAVTDANHNTKWGFIDTTGKEVIPLQYSKSVKKHF